MISSNRTALPLSPSGASLRPESADCFRSTGSRPVNLTKPLGRISKRGDGYLRRLLVHGARADLRWSKHRKERRSLWQESLLARRPTNVVLVAMANKTARVVWAMLSRGEAFRPEARTEAQTAA